MKQIAIQLATAASLAAGVLTAALWGRSFRACDVLLQPRGPGDRACVTSEFGLMVFEWEAGPRVAVQPGWEYFRTPTPRRWPAARGPAMPAAYVTTVRHFVRLPPSAAYGVAVPHWMIIFACGVLPAWWALDRRRRRAQARRRTAGLCTRCGYDLRESRGRCPECGQATTASIACA